MSVEILTVGLDEETIDKLANILSSRLANLLSQSVTPPEQNTRRTQTDQVSRTDDQGWEKPDSVPAPQPDSAPDSTPDSAPDSAPAVRVPRCNHGEMRHVKAGFSQRTNKAYGAFYGCPAPRGQEQCKSIQASEWEARMAEA